MGTKALGKSSGAEVKVLKDSPGPQNIKAWNSGDDGTLDGIAELIL